MRYERFPALERDVSRLVLGTTVYRDAPPDARVDLLDAWLEVGGNAFDCAREYGASEGILGRWMEARGCREDVVVATKCAHGDESGSRVTPEAIAADLAASLADLRTSYVDLVLLHRDDPDVPVGPILEALNEHREAGRLRAFGASNWSTSRLDEAARYASRHAVEGFSCSSANLALAVQNEPYWPGTVSASDPASRAWYARTGIPLLAWSAQAGGFFTGRYCPDDRSSGDVARVYYSDENWERARRAEELGRKKGASANEIALAWVLRQPFPVFAVVGPRTVAEVHATTGALAVELTPEEVRWLALETP